MAAMEARDAAGIFAGPPLHTPGGFGDLKESEDELCPSMGSDALRAG